MEEVKTDDAPIADAPLSQALTTEDFVFVSGQVPVDPESGEIVDGDVKTETRQTMENISSILTEAGCSLDDIVKATVFINDVSDFKEMNEVYSEYMGEPYPARSAIEVGNLAMDITVEIEVIAER